MALAVNTARTTLELVAESDSDRAFLERLYASTRMQELAPVPWTDDQKAAFLHAQFEAQDASYREHFSDAVRQLIQVDGTLAGRLYVQRREHELRIIDIALLPEFRGRGIGALLLAQVLEEAGATSKAVRIHVEKNNPAYRLYQRLGFIKLEDKGVYDLLEWRAQTIQE